MFYSYPAAATSENWLHWCLIMMLVEIHDAVDAGTAPPAWPGSIPQQYRENLRPKHGIKSKLKTYADTLKTLGAKERSEIREALIRQNQLKQVFGCHHNCKQIDELPKLIQEPIKILFEQAFSLLSDFDVRDKHYRIIYEAAKQKICPFCGLEPFDAPGAPREDDDHYLPRSRYAFAGANLRNLVPMGLKCNSRYKKAADPLHDDSGRRRRVLNPYAGKCFRISLMSTVAFGSGRAFSLDWKIEFDPATEEAETWDSIFRIRERFRRDIFSPSWEDWLDDFVGFAEELRMPAGFDIRDALIRYLRYLKRGGLRNRLFLMFAFFEMLLDRFDNGHADVNRKLTSITKHIM